MRFERTIGQIPKQHSSSKFGSVGLPTRKHMYHEGATVETDPSRFDRRQPSSNTYVPTQPVIRIDRIEPSISTGLSKYRCPSECRVLRVHISSEDDGDGEESGERKAVSGQERSGRSAITVNLSGKRQQQRMNQAKGKLFPNSSPARRRQHRSIPRPVRCATHRSSTGDGAVCASAEPVTVAA